MTVTLRDGVTWSDGKPFGIDDVVFTLEMLLENGRGKKDLLNAASLASAVKGVTKVDGKTIRIDFTEPDPRFAFKYLINYFDIGLQWLPPMSGRSRRSVVLPQFRSRQGLAGDDGPVDGHALHRQPGLHGPARQLVGRGRGARADAGDPARDHDPGRHARPDGAAHRRQPVDIVNDVQIAEVMRQLMTQNPKITSFTGTKPPFGARDWWPTSLYFNHKSPKWADVRVRRAINHYLDRKQLIDVAYNGASEPKADPSPASAH